MYGEPKRAMNSKGKPKAERPREHEQFKAGVRDSRRRDSNAWTGWEHKIQERYVAGNILEETTMPEHTWSNSKMIILFLLSLLWCCQCLVYIGKERSNTPANKHSKKKFVPNKNGYIGIAVEQSVHYCPKAGYIPYCLAMASLIQTGS